MPDEPPRIDRAAIDHSEMPIVAALRSAMRAGGASFGAPGHSRGRAAPAAAVKAIGASAFKADLLSPKGLEDRTESGHALMRAHELAAAAWGAGLCRFSTGGSTQSIQTALAAVARPGDTILLAQNAHKAEFAAALFMGLEPVILPAVVDADWDLEHGVAEPALAAALAAHPRAKAVVIVSPSYFGVTSDIAALARVAHGHGVPLIVDAAWGGAFAFSGRLPADPLACGADVAVSSLHKTMGALGQGSAMLANGGIVDLQRFALAYELFQTTSPSVAILASLDATRSEHALDGERLWAGVLDRAELTRTAIAAIPGLRVLGRERLDGGGAHDLDISKITIDVSALGIAGYAIDDWLFAEHGITVGLSDARHLLAVISAGTTAGECRTLVRGLKSLVAALRRDPAMLPRAGDLPGIGSLAFEAAMPAPAAFFAETELVRLEDATGRIAAEIVAPAPPGVPRLVPGQRITPAHVRFLAANRDAGAFILDPADPAERRLRVVREPA